MDFRMPKLGLTMEEGTVVEWLKKPGDDVEKGEPVVTVETDKSILEVETPESGTLREIVAEEGDTVQVNGVLAVIAQSGAETDEVDVQPDSVQTPHTDAFPASVGIPAAPLPKASSSGDRTTEGGTTQRLSISPRARMTAREAGLNESELQSVRGRGPGGRIIERDVHEYLNGRTVVVDEVQVAQLSPDASPPEPSSGNTFHGLPGGFVPIGRVRKITAQRMTESVSSVPQFFVGVDVDIGSALELKDWLRNKKGVAETKVTLTDILVKVTAHVLLEQPDVNAAFAGDAVFRFSAVNIGVAMAVEEGLVVPVVHHADQKGLREISRETAGFKERATEGALRPDDLSGGTFTISNLGMFGVAEFTAIVNPPQAGILAVGGVKETFVKEGGELLSRPTMRLNLTVDHRVLDGAGAARFTGRLKEVLENPLLLLI